MFSPCTNTFVRPTKIKRGIRYGFMDYKLICLEVGALGTNCYVLKKACSDSAVVIDPGEDAELIKGALDELNAFPGLILLTHGHFDHILALQEIKTEESVVAIHKCDAEFLTSRDVYSAMLPEDPRPFPPADVLFSDGQGFTTLSDYEFEVIHTPGHTEGSVCYRFGEMLFTGDTLFKNSIGRTDLLGGNSKKLSASLRMLSSFSENFKVFPGHGEQTELFKEKECNPYLKYLNETGRDL